MNQAKPRYRVLAIAPSSRGFGYAVLEGRDTLVDWGGKVASGDKNKQSLHKIDRLFASFRPNILVLEDASAKSSRRATRIRKLSAGIVALAKRHKVRVTLFSRSTIKETLLADDNRTKHDVAKVVGELFPDEIAIRVPPKRRPWESEARRMDVFDAIALAVVWFSIGRKRQSS